MRDTEKLRKRIFEIVQIGNHPDLLSIAFDIFITVVIALNLFVTLYSTFDSSVRFAGLLKAIELLTILIFTAEYILRLWTAKYLYPKLSDVTAACRFVFSFFGMIDLLSILPYYLPLVFPQGAVAFRILRVFRILRLFRINAQYDAFNVIADVLKAKKNELIASICLILILMTASALCMYSFEHEAQPEVFQNAFSGLWWSMSTLLTIGYGDIYPVTIGGRITAIIIAFLGVGLVAIPTGILSAGFVGQLSKYEEKLAKSDIIPETGYISIQIGETHPWFNKKLSDLLIPPQLDPLLILRDGSKLLPLPDITLLENDTLIFDIKKL
ncbi:MAG: ion transporter [Lachnospiraceae bacterium]|nr:ion transporter [Lachnospiraceae bacterium]